MNNMCLAGSKFLHFVERDASFFLQEKSEMKLCVTLQNQVKFNMASPVSEKSVIYSVKSSLRNFFTVCVPFRRSLCVLLVSFDVCINICIVLGI